MNDLHNSSKPITAGFEPTFFGKVMTFFGLAMLASAAGTYLTVTYYLDYFVQYPFLIWLFFALELLIIFTSRTWSKKVPINRFLFALFAFITGVTIAPLIGLLAAIPQGPDLIMKALLTTGLVFGGTAILGWTTNLDLSGLRGFLFMGLIGMIIVSVIGIFIPWGSTFELVFSGVGVLLFSAFTVYDFQKIKNFPQDQYIDAALMLYLDIFNLFLYVLRFMMAFASRD